MALLVPSLCAGRSKDVRDKNWQSSSTSDSIDGSNLDLIHGPPTRKVKKKTEKKSTFLLSAVTFTSPLEHIHLSIGLDSNQPPPSCAVELKNLSLPFLFVFCSRNNYSQFIWPQVLQAASININIVFNLLSKLRKINNNKLDCRKDRQPERKNNKLRDRVLQSRERRRAAVRNRARREGGSLGNENLLEYQLQSQKSQSTWQREMIRKVE